MRTQRRESALSSLMESYIPTEITQKFFNLIKLKAISGKANKSCPKLQACSHSGRARGYKLPLMGTVFVQTNMFAILFNHHGIVNLPFI